MRQTNIYPERLTGARGGTPDTPSQNRRCVRCVCRVIQQHGVKTEGGVHLGNSQEELNRLTIWNASVHSSNHCTFLIFIILIFHLKYIR